MEKDIALPSLPINTHPYLVRVLLTIGSNAELIGEDNLRLPFAGNYILTAFKDDPTPTEQANFFKRITVDLESFSSLDEAKQAGNLLVSSLLWTAVSKRVTIGVKKYEDFPFAILDRNQLPRIKSQAELISFYNISSEEIYSLAEKVYLTRKVLPSNVITSMELYASARLESTEMARFITLITAIEALAEQREYSTELKELLDGFASSLKKSPLFKEEGESPLFAEEENPLSFKDKQSIMCSLVGRINGKNSLCQESVGQAIKRILRKHIQEQDDIKFVEKAYRERSNILHNGIIPSELSVLTNRLESIIRKIYSSILDMSLDR